MEKLIKIRLDKVILEGMLVVPTDATLLVIFAHGSGSSRLSPRNNFVASILQKAKIGTLLIDLLTKNEDEIYETRFDINLLTERLSQIARWIKEHPETQNLALGLFGASTGAAAALKTAAQLPKEITAVVSRGGRPDLAIDELKNVTAPTLLIVGGDDTEVIALNRIAFAKLKSVKRIEIVPGATHLFEEPGTLEKVAELATAWFKQYNKV
ncbi:MAG TPA: dienelactone hydrolase family protein [Patescibacteria group bacterium]